MRLSASERAAIISALDIQRSQCYKMEDKVGGWVGGPCACMHMHKRTSCTAVQCSLTHTCVPLPPWTTFPLYRTQAMILAEIEADGKSIPDFNDGLRLALLLQPLSYAVDLRRLGERSAGTQWDWLPVQQWLAAGRSGPRALCVLGGAGEGERERELSVCLRGLPAWTGRCLGCAQGRDGGGTGRGRKPGWLMRCQPHDPPWRPVSHGCAGDLPAAQAVEETARGPAPPAPTGLCMSTEWIGCLAVDAPLPRERIHPLRCHAPPVPPPTPQASPRSPPRWRRRRPTPATARGRWSCTT